MAGEFNSNFSFFFFFFPLSCRKKTNSDSIFAGLNPFFFFSHLIIAFMGEILAKRKIKDML